MARTIRSVIEGCRKELGRYGQEHLLQFAEELGRESQQELLDEIKGQDFDLITELVEKYVVGEQAEGLPKEILPPGVYPNEPTAELERKYQTALELGERQIADRKVAAFTVAGGMGTRLNFSGPKGCLPATPLRNKCLFRVFAESLIASGRSTLRATR